MDNLEMVHTIKVLFMEEVIVIIPEDHYAIIAMIA